jgi:hypothetical protein
VIYFLMNSDGYVKIGRSSRFRSRYKQLCHEYNQRLKILGILEESKFSETHLHQVFATLRIAGEWFIPNRKLHNFIKKNCSEWKPEFDLPDEKVVRIDRYLFFQLECIARAKGVSVEALLDEMLRDNAHELYSALPQYQKFKAD